MLHNYTTDTRTPSLYVHSDDEIRFVVTPSSSCSFNKNNEKRIVTVKNNKKDIIQCSD